MPSLGVRLASAPHAPVETRRRSLLGREVLYAPRQPDDPSGPSDPTVDRSVSPAAYEAVQDQKQSTAVGGSASSLAPPGESSPGHKGNGQDRLDLPVPSNLLPLPPSDEPGRLSGGQEAPDAPRSRTPMLPSPTVPSSDQPGTSERSAAAPEPSHGTPSAGDEKEPYSFCKRFLRGYPTLVDWFPDHLGLPRKTTEELPQTRAGETRVEAARSSQVLPGALRPAPGIRRRFRCRSTRVIRSLESLQVRPRIPCRRLSIWARMGTALKRADWRCTVG